MLDPDPDPVRKKQRHLDMAITHYYYFVYALGRNYLNDGYIVMCAFPEENSRLQSRCFREVRISASPKN